MDLYFARESLDEVLVDNAVGGSEEGEDVGDEEALVIVQAVVPVVEILGEIDLLCGPERSLGLLVHLPDIVVLDGEQDEASRVLLKEGLFGLLLLDRGRDDRLDLLKIILEVIWDADDGLEGV